MADSILDLIKQLRERTGAGLMDCKKALLENGNDVDKAADWLREKGIAKQAKKAATRIAAEGVADVLVDGNKASVLEINSETDFVANSDPFRALVKEVNAIVLAKEPTSVEQAMECTNAEGKSIKDLFLDASIKLGEKLDFRRFVIVKKNDDETFGPYIHMRGKIATLVVIKGGDKEVANGIALNVCSMNPSYKTFDEIPEDVRAKELAIQTEASKQDPNFAKKPEAIQAKIVDGRVRTALGESVLTEEPYVLDEHKKVGQFLQEHNACVVTFVRYAVGEGIEKRQDDFAAEVAAQAAGK